MKRRLAAEKCAEKGEEGANERERKGLTPVENYYKKSALTSLSVICLLATTVSLSLYFTFLPSSSEYKCNVYNMQVTTVWEDAARHEVH